MKKKILSLLLLIISFLSLSSISYANEVPKNLTFNKEFRAVWITNITGDVGTYYSKNGFISEMETVFSVMGRFNLNAMIFHIRTHNNALYKSDLNPLSIYWRNVNFDEFDPLEWLIEECHKRGYEFHAWMNPYRVSSGQYATALPAVNPASDSKNLLNYGLLNPGLPNVREFLIDTVMEVIENYDVDAIHFDDYFYTNLGANGELTGAKTILDEPDQVTFLTYPGNYNTSSAYDKAEWRREQVNLFIEGLHNEISNYNEQNGKHVQLGISPTGIYKNGNGIVTYDENGKPITTGSDTGGQMHYSSYLFADSLKWAIEGWVDYLIPQSYWATDHSVASYYKLMDWWNKVFANLDVNLYSGIGIYQAEEANRFSWTNTEDQLYKQLSYVEELENVRGVSFYAYKHLKGAYNNQSTNSSRNLQTIGRDIWFTKRYLPEIRTMAEIIPGEISNFKIKGDQLSWDKLDGAKFYIIFKVDGLAMDFSEDEIFAIVGGNEVSYIDLDSHGYTYGIKAMSYTNSLGKESYATILPPDPKPGYSISFYVDNYLLASFASDFNFEIPKIPTKVGYDKISPVWSITDFTNITKDIRVDAIYTKNTYFVKFYDSDGNLIETINVAHGSAITPPNPPKLEGYEFKEWDKDLSNITSDLEVNPIYEEINKGEDSLFSCKKLNYSFTLFAGLFALFMFIRRKK
ncbi:MAG: family 10 glycosylhydrolase [Bacilli bacterium]